MIEIRFTVAVEPNEVRKDKFDIVIRRDGTYIGSPIRSKTVNQLEPMLAAIEMAVGIGARGMLDAIRMDLDEYRQVVRTDALNGGEP